MFTAENMYLCLNKRRAATANVDGPPAARIAILSMGLAVLLGCADQPSAPSAPPRDVRPSESNDPQTISQSVISADYVADADCADCHFELYTSYQAIGMARSFSKFDPDQAVESFEANPFYHQPSDRHYAMSVQDGRMVVTRYRLREDGTRMNERAQRVDYVIGSGNHVRGYFYRNDAGEMFEMPIVWYTQPGHWGMAPGYDHPDHEGFDRPVTRQCMFCHNAYPRCEPGQDAFGTPHTFPADLPQGIGCQRCHGPGSEHVRLAEAAHADLSSVQDSIVNPIDLEPRLRDDVCLQCHLQPMSRRTSIVRRFGTSDYSFRPGHRLDDHFAYFELDDSASNEDRFEINHHPYRLYQSACYLRSDRALTCLTCHDPHAKVSAEPQQRAAHYRQRCLQCHGVDDCLDQQARAPQANCVGCHMPQRRTQDVVHVVMTDHKIARRSALANPRAALAEQAIPIQIPPRVYVLEGHQQADSVHELAGVAWLRDQSPAAIGRMESLLAEQRPSSTEPLIQLGQSQLEAGLPGDAVATLKQTLARGHNSALLHTNLGSALVALEVYEEALAHLRQATAGERVRPEALFNQGLALARLGRDQESIESYLRALELRPTYAKCRFNLGNALARTGALEAAAEQFQARLNLDPDDAVAYRNLSSAYRLQGQWAQALQALKDGRQAAPEDALLARDLALAYLDTQNRQLRNVEQALVAAETFAELKPRDAEARLLVGLALVLNNRSQEALEELPRIEAAGDLASAHALVVALARQQLGEKEPTKEEVSKSIQQLRDQPLSRLEKIVVETARAQLEVD